MRRTTTRPTSFRPRLDVLEDRTCPSVTATQSGNLLFITGNGSNDTVTVTAKAPHQFKVQNAAGTSLGTFSGIAGISANLGNGTNVAKFEMGQDSQTGVTYTGGTGIDVVRFDYTNGISNGGDHGGLLINANLGDGNNDLTLKTTNGFSGKSLLHLNVTAGSGNDQVRATNGVLLDDAESHIKANLGAGNNNFAASVVGMTQDSKFTTDLTTGAGNDTASVAISTILDAQATVNANLGDGTNTFSSNVSTIDRGGEYTLNVNTGAGADTVIVNFQNISNDDDDVHVNVHTGGGNDTINTAITNTVDGDADIEANLDGGAGTDTLNAHFGAATGVADVNLRNIETVNNV